MKDLQEQKQKKIKNNLSLCDVFSLSDLNVGDKIKMQFAHRYRREFGWDIFSFSDYIVKEINEKYIQLINCKHQHESHKLFNIGSKNSKEWIVGKYVY